MALPSVRRMNCELDVPATTGLSVFEALETRRAIKHFDPAFALDDATLRRLLTAAALAPTAFNIQRRPPRCSCCVATTARIVAPIATCATRQRRPARRWSR